MLPVLVRNSLPDWLARVSSTDVELPIENILQRSVFYPASYLDGRPVKFFGGYSHSFVYLDCNVTQEDLLNCLDTFRGYRLIHSRTVERRELCFRRFRWLRPIRKDGDPAHLHVREDFKPYAVWAIFERRAEFDEAHGPERFNLLFVGGEGAATFQELYYSNRCSPSVIALIRSDGFTGNWTSFCDPALILARSVIQNPFGQPDFLFGVSERGTNSSNSPWPWYPNPLATVASYLNYDGVTHQRLQLWGRGSADQAQNSAPRPP